MHDTELSEPHVAYAIGRPVGPAVVRNRIRRRLRAIVVHHADAIRPAWYLIGVRPAAATRSYEELNTMFERILQRIPEASQ